MDKVTIKRKKGNDFWNFNILSGKGLIRVIYPMGVVFIILEIIIKIEERFMSNPNFIMLFTAGLIGLFIVNLVWRLICEFIVAIFDIRESLSKNKNLDEESIN